MSMIVKDLGIVTAYGYAVAGGYTGTEAEFIQLMEDIIAAGVPAEAILAVLGNIAEDYDSDSPYAVGDYCIHSRQFYRCNTDIPEGEEWNALHWTAVTVSDIFKDFDEALATKAEIDGLYEDMTVGNAEQLTSTLMVEDSELYNFRSTGGSADVGNRAYIDSIVGGTVVWNQLVSPTVSDDGIIGWRTLASTGSLSVDEDGALVYTMSRGGASEYRRAFQSINIPAGHVVRLRFEIMEVATDLESVPINPVDIAYNLSPISAVQASGDTPARHIFSFAESGVWYAKDMLIQHTSDDKYVYFGTRSATTGKNIVLSLRNVVVQDITLMFGTAIADYINGLEQATPGAGVAWFRKYFPKNYYAYDPGSLQSVLAASHETVGFNAYNHSTGTARLLGGNQYQITGAYTALAYEDINGDAETITPDSDGYFTPTSNGTLTATAGDGSTTCVHLVWSGYRNGDFEPYIKRSYSLDDSLELRGIPKLDAANNLYFDGDTYESDGTVTRRYSIVDLGSISWNYDTSGAYPYFRHEFTYVASVNNKTLADAVCSSIQQVTAYAIRTSGAKGFGFDNRTIRVAIDNMGTDPAAFKTMLSGVYLVVKRNASYIAPETAEPYQSLQVVDDFGTEEYVDAAVQAGTRDVAIPVGHNTRYPANLRDKLQHLPNLADGDGRYVIQQSGNQMALTPDTSPDRLYEVEATLTEVEGKLPAILAAFPQETIADAPIADFSDGADGLPVKDLVIDITPVQAGNGDPSPENVRPISGWTGATITGIGENYTKDLWAQRKGIDSETGNVRDITGAGAAEYYCSPLIRLSSEKKLYRDIQCATSAYRAYVYARYDENGNFLTATTGTTGTHTHLTSALDLSSEPNTAYIRIQYGLGTGTIKCCATTEQKHTVSWQTEAGTVYGGTLDVLTGVLVVDKGLVVYDGSGDEVWTKGSTIEYYIQNNSVKRTKNYIGQIVCDKLKTYYASNHQVDYGISGFVSNGYPGENWIYVFLTSATTKAEFLAFLAENPITVVYPLATPQTYQLTPTEVKTLLGGNNIWADTGNVNTLTYRADPQRYVDKRINATKSIIAGVEVAMTATKNYSIGDLLIVGDTLYTVTVNIANGGSITPGTNVTATTVAEQLLALANA